MYDACYMVAGVLHDLLQEDGGNWHVQNLVIGSQPVPRSMMQKASARCDRLYTLYGSTEIGCVTSGEVDTGGKFLDYQAGGPLPGAEIKVKDNAFDYAVSH